ncbi:MAG: PAS domain S-box protein [Caldithrix sp.]|nr:MAG: PAS domain S-box protein [Caldithrix sp.]
MDIAEETIRESEKRFRDIFNAVNDGILIIDPGEYRIVETNQKASDLLGYDEEELVGLLIEKIHPEEMVQLKRTLDEVLRGQPVQTDEFSCLRKDKHRLPAEISFSAVRLNDKTCVMAMVRDITERNRAGEEIKSLAKFPAENPNPIMRISKDGEIIYSNEGSSPLRKTWKCKDDCFLPDELRDQISHIFKSGTSEEVEVNCDEQVFSILFSPIADAGYVNVYASDITERKHAEEALRKALNEIEQLKNRLQAENIYLQEEIKIQHNFEEIIGAGAALKKSLRKVEQVASTDSTVLILGETGTGKELLARAVHNLSDRRDRPLVKVNCAALPANLIESELFGHEKGAFTGAVARKIGRFELADGGTIFLDEIGDLSLELQSKLLRVLQEGEFERVGNPQTTKVDVRIISATNRDLEKAIEDGSFREDLYYRLNVFPIQSPPLRERKEDIPILARHFIKKFAIRTGKKIETVPQKVMDALQGYHWPGNVRELENIIERAVIISTGKQLRIEDWLSKTVISSKVSRITTLAELEREHILEVLELTRWRVSGESGAAKVLGLKSTTLEARMKKLSIQRKA